MSGAGRYLHAIFAEKLIRVHVQVIADTEYIVERKRYIVPPSAAVAAALALKLNGRRCLHMIPLMELVAAG